MPTKLIAATLAVVIILASPAVCQQQAQTPADLSRIAGIKGAATGPGETFRFVIMGDRNGGQIEGMWEDAVAQVNALQPDFVICVGDLIPGYTEDPVELARQWDEFARITARLDAPFFFCPGNHDTSNDMMLKEYVARWGVSGKSYYSFNYRGCHFVVLDSNTAKRLPGFAEEQFKWLEADLATAKDTRRVFLLYHFPAWVDDKPFWQTLVKLVDPAKTTIFNGHWHTYVFDEQDGIPSYVIAATGAEAGEGGRDMGDFHMLVHVTVTDGRPKLAVLPLGEVLSGDFLTGAMLKEREAILDAFWISPQKLEGGVAATVRQSNPGQVPLTVSLAWEAPGCTVSGQPTELAIGPGESSQASFRITGPVRDNRPRVKASYRLAEPSGKQLALRRTNFFPEFVDVPRIIGIVVDGDLGDWESLKSPPATTQPTDARTPADLSCTARVGWGNGQFYLAAEVTDDSVYAEDPAPTGNDGIEFCWHVPPHASPGDPNVPSTGRVVLAVPKEGQSVSPSWRIETNKTPPKLTAICRRTPGGYVYELSVPLADLGAKTPPAAGQELIWGVVINDRDVVDGEVQKRVRFHAGAMRNAAQILGLLEE